MADPRHDPAPYDEGRPQQGGLDEPSGLFAPEDLIAPRSGKVGETLEGATMTGARAGWRVISIEYPADDVFIDAGLTIPEGYASAIIGALFTNKGSVRIDAVPVDGLCLIDTTDGLHLAAKASVDSHPGFRSGPVQPEETIAGHRYYLIDKDLGVRGVQWHDGGDVLTWLR